MIRDVFWQRRKKDMTLDKLTIKAQDAVAVAQQKASEYNHQQIEPEQ